MEWEGNYVLNLWSKKENRWSKKYSMEKYEEKEGSNVGKKKDEEKKEKEVKNKLHPFSKRYTMICSLIRWLRFKFRVTILPLSDLLFFVLFLPTLVFLTFLLPILSGRERE